MEVAPIAEANSTIPVKRVDIDRGVGRDDGAVVGVNCPTAGDSDSAVPSDRPEMVQFAIDVEGAPAPDAFGVHAQVGGRLDVKGPARLLKRFAGNQARSSCRQY